MFPSFSHFLKQLKTQFYLFLAVLGVHCCRGYSSCGEWASPVAEQTVGRSCFSSCAHWAQQLRFLGSRAQAQ